MSNTATATATMGHLAPRPDSSCITPSLSNRRRSCLVPSLAFPRSHMLQPKESSFFRLPAEIRNAIYTDLFQHTEERIRPDYTLPGLLTSCKQVYTEAIRLYYNTTTFRCLDEDSTVSWLSNLPTPFLELVPEVRYDTRWIVFMTPMIPVPGMECHLFQSLVKQLEERDFDVNQLGQRVGKDGEPFGEGKLKVSFYGKGGGGVKWTDKPGLIEDVRAGGMV